MSLDGKTIGNMVQMRKHWDNVLQVVGPAIQLDLYLVHRIVDFYNMLDELWQLKNTPRDLQNLHARGLRYLFVAQSYFSKLILDWSRQKNGHDTYPLRCIVCFGELDFDHYSMFIMRSSRMEFTIGLAFHSGQCQDDAFKLWHSGLQKFGLAADMNSILTYFRVTNIDAVRKHDLNIKAVYKVPPGLRICWACLSDLREQKCYRCAGCRFATFCGKKCYKKLWRTRHKADCGFCKSLAVRYAGIPHRNKNSVRQVLEQFAEQANNTEELDFGVSFARAQEKVLDAVMFVWSSEALRFSSK